MSTEHGDPRVAPLRDALIQTIPNITATELKRGMGQLRRFLRVGDILRSTGWERLKRKREQNVKGIGMISACLDDRNIVTLIASTLDMQKEPAAVNATHRSEVEEKPKELKGAENIPFEEIGGKAQIIALDSGVFIVKLRQSAADPNNRSFTAINEMHTALSGEQVCGGMLGLAEEFDKAGKRWPEASLLEWNLARLNEGPIPAITTGYNLARLRLGRTTQPRVCVPLAFDHDSYGPILEYNHERPMDSFKTADLERGIRSRLASTVADKIGEPGSYRTKFTRHSDPNFLLDFANSKLEGALLLLNDTRFKDFQLMTSDWVDKYEGLDQNQHDFVWEQIAEYVIQQYLLGTSDVPIPSLARHHARDIYVSRWGITLGQRDPSLNRFAGSPPNPSGMTKQIKTMWGIINEHEQEDLRKRNEYLAKHIGESRFVFISAPTDNPNVNEETLATSYARMDLVESMQEIHEDPVLYQMKQTGQARFIPVIVGDLGTPYKIPRLVV